jgi:thiol-disulfide isomerase/thioredoxin
MLLRYTLSLILLLLTLPAYSVEADEPAPIIALPQLENNVAGKMTSIADYKGKLIYLDFWASWCGPCRQSFPFLKEIRQQYVDQGFEIIAVNVDAKLEDGLRFLKKFPVDYPTLLDPKGVMSRAYLVQGLPTAFLIDREGNIIYEHLGFKERDKKWITALIEQNITIDKK